MSDTPAEPTAEDQHAAAVAYVRDDLWPPLPEPYGPWLVTLAARARQGEDPDIMLTVPKAVRATGVIPPGVHHDTDGTILISLADALRALKQEELLYPEEDDTDLPELEVMTPEIALALANTADADLWHTTYDPAAVQRLAHGLTTGGDWPVYLREPIHVDEQGRISNGLNALLAIVRANTRAPVSITYAYDASPRPLTWRAPAATSTERNP